MTRRKRKDCAKTVKWYGIKVLEFVYYYLYSKRRRIDQGV
jgi:hypothetical protein